MKILYVALPCLAFLGTFAYGAECIESGSRACKPCHLPGGGICPPGEVISLEPLYQAVEGYRNGVFRETDYQSQPVPREAFLNPDGTHGWTEEITFIEQQCQEYQRIIQEVITVAIQERTIIERDCGDGTLRVFQEENGSVKIIPIGERRWIQRITQCLITETTFQRTVTIFQWQQVGDLETVIIKTTDPAPSE